jgi:hypothetical protein
MLPLGVLRNRTIGSVAALRTAILATNPQSEDRWINEGLSMLAQDFAVHNLFPQVSLDVDDALEHTIVFLNNPENFSLTGFTGVDPRATTLLTKALDCASVGRV